MKTFKDLVFKPHTAGQGLRATCFFDNGYGVSVVRFGMPGFPGMYGSYTSNEHEWELAVLFGDDKDWELTYNTPITDDVIGYISDKEVTKIMKQVQKLK